jgi:DNA repair protein RadC
MSILLDLTTNCLEDKKEKPREKIRAHGIESLNDAELLSAIFGTGYKKMGIEELSKYLLAEFGTRGLFQFQSLEELQEATGLPHVKSCILLAISEYFRRLQKRDNVKIKSSEQFYEYIKDDFRKTPFEQLRIVCLDSQRRVLYSGLVAQGESDRLSVPLLSVLHHPIRLNIRHFCLAHNHPQGDCQPSREDTGFTLRLKEVCDQFGLSFDDHLIIGKEGYYSFSLKGVL